MYSQNSDGSFDIASKVIDSSKPKEVKELNLKNISLKKISDNVVEIYLEGLLRTVEFYQKNNILYVFDNVGNCFETMNHGNTIVKTKEQIVDKEFIKTQMPGIVVKLVYKKGDQVKKGDSVAFLEAMKMEHKILAQENVVIKEVLVKEKSFVEAGQPLYRLEVASTK